MKIRLKTVQQLLADGANFNEDGHLIRENQEHGGFDIMILSGQLHLLGTEVVVNFNDNHCGYTDVDNNDWIEVEIEEVIEDKKTSEQLADEIIDKEFELEVLKVLAKHGLI